MSGAWAIASAVASVCGNRASRNASSHPREDVVAMDEI